MLLGMPGHEIRDHHGRITCSRMRVPTGLANTSPPPFHEMWVRMSHPSQCPILYIFLTWEEWLIAQVKGLRRCELLKDSGKCHLHLTHIDSTDPTNRDIEFPTKSGHFPVEANKQEFPRFFVNYALHFGKHPKIMANGVVVALNHLLMHEDGKRVYQCVNGTHLCAVDLDAAYIICATKVASREVIHLKPYHYEHIANNQAHVAGEGSTRSSSSRADTRIHAPQGNIPELSQLDIVEAANKICNIEDADDVQLLKVWMENKQEPDIDAPTVEKTTLTTIYEEEEPVETGTASSSSLPQGSPSASLAGVQQSPQDPSRGTAGTLVLEEKASTLISHPRDADEADVDFGDPEADDGQTSEPAASPSSQMLPPSIANPTPDSGSVPTPLLDEIYAVDRITGATDAGHLIRASMRTLTATSSSVELTLHLAEHALQLAPLVKDAIVLLKSNDMIINRHFSVSADNVIVIETIQMQGVPNPDMQSAVGHGRFVDILDTHIEGSPSPALPADITTITPRNYPPALSPTSLPSGSAGANICKVCGAQQDATATCPKCRRTSRILNLLEVRNLIYTIKHGAQEGQRRQGIEQSVWGVASDLPKGAGLAVVQSAARSTLPSWWRGISPGDEVQKVRNYARRAAKLWEVDTAPGGTVRFCEWFINLPDSTPNDNPHFIIGGILGGNDTRPWTSSDWKRSIMVKIVDSLGSVEHAEDYLWQLQRFMDDPSITRDNMFYQHRQHHQQHAIRIRHEDSSIQTPVYLHPDYPKAIAVHKSVHGRHVSEYDAREGQGAYAKTRDENAFARRARQAYVAEISTSMMKAHQVTKGKGKGKKRAAASITPATLAASPPVKATTSYVPPVPPLPTVQDTTAHPSAAPRHPPPTVVSPHISEPKAPAKSASLTGVHSAIPPPQLPPAGYVDADIDTDALHWRHMQVVDASHYGPSDEPVPFDPLPPPPAPPERPIAQVPAGAKGTPTLGPRYAQQARQTSVNAAKRHASETQRAKARYASSSLASVRLAAKPGSPNLALNKAFQAMGDAAEHFEAVVEEMALQEERARVQAGAAAPPPPAAAPLRVAPPPPPAPPSRGGVISDILRSVEGPPKPSTPTSTASGSIDRSTGILHLRQSTPTPPKPPSSTWRTVTMASGAEVYKADPPEPPKALAIPASTSPHAQWRRVSNLPRDPRTFADIDAGIGIVPGVSAPLTSPPPIPKASIVPKNVTAVANPPSLVARMGLEREEAERQRRLAVLDRRAEDAVRAHGEYGEPKAKEFNIQQTVQIGRRHYNFLTDFPDVEWRAPPARPGGPPRPPPRWAMSSPGEGWTAREPRRADFPQVAPYMYTAWLVHLGQVQSIVHPKAKVTPKQAATAAGMGWDERRGAHRESWQADVATTTPSPERPPPSGWYGSSQGSNTWEDDDDSWGTWRGQWHHR